MLAFSDLTNCSMTGKGTFVVMVTIMTMLIKVGQWLKETMLTASGNSKPTAVSCVNVQCFFDPSIYLTSSLHGLPCITLSSDFLLCSCHNYTVHQGFITQQQTCCWHLFFSIIEMDRTCREREQRSLARINFHHHHHLNHSAY